MCKKFSFIKNIYRNNLKNRECGKKAPQNFDSERATIADRQGVSENRNFEEKPTPPKTDSSSCFGIVSFSPVFVIAPLLNAVGALFEGISFGFILLGFSALGSASWLPPLFSKWLPLYLTSLSGTSLFIISIILATSVQILRSSLHFLAQLLTVHLSTRVQIDLQKKIYEKIMRLSFSTITTHKTGDLIEYVKTPSTTVQPLLSSSNQAVAALFSIFALIAMMIVLSPLLMLLSLLVFGTLGLLQKKLLKRIAKLSEELAIQLARLSEAGVESLYGLKEIFIFNRENEMIEKIGKKLFEIGSITKRMHGWKETLGPLNEILSIFLISVFLLVSYSIIQEKASLALLLTFITIVYRISGRLHIFFHNLGISLSHLGSILRIKEILEKPEKPSLSLPLDPLVFFRESIAFHRVSLHHKNTRLPSLKNISFTIPKGKMIALVGKSGSGKSSLLDLLLRLYEPTAGAISCDGKNIQAYSINSWRNLFGVVSQDVCIFHETIEENIRFGCKAASLDEVAHAAKLSSSVEFIEKLEKTYQTTIGERGAHLSGGEKQRLAIARALLRNPQILLFDEGTSSLDPLTEFLIQETLLSYKGAKTVVFTSHNPFMALHADEIFVMDQGEIAERGSHKELLEQEGLYASLWQSQVKSHEQHIFK